VPNPSLRINLASVLATFLDLLFLAMAWEWLGLHLRRAYLGLRAFLTLLGVMWLDVFLFSSGAFAGQGAYVAIMQGTAASRLIVCLFAGPLLWLYLSWQNRRWHANLERRPVLAIFKEFADIKAELTLAQQEIERRKAAEQALLQSRQELERLAVTDDLTGLANRRSFRELAETEISRCRRYGRPLCLAVLDLDQFKRINDRLGHQVGDEVLQAVARIGREQIRQSDLLARLGGDELALLLPETDLEQGRALAGRLLDALCGQPLATSAGPVSLGVSLGLASLESLDAKQRNLQGLLKEADRRMYQAKPTCKS
jgi:diguanylate cyclase (GGDEF)-like protein